MFGEDQGAFHAFVGGETAMGEHFGHHLNVEVWLALLPPTFASDRNRLPSLLWVEWKLGREICGGLRQVCLRKNVL